MVGIAISNQKRMVGSGASGKAQPSGSANLFCKPTFNEVRCRLKGTTSNRGTFENAEGHFVREAGAKFLKRNNVNANEQPESKVVTHSTGR